MKPILVIYYYVRGRVIDQVSREWGKVIVMPNPSPHPIQPYILKIIKIDKEKAMKLIESRGLTLVLSNKDGDLYDTPDQQFLSEYKGLLDLDKTYEREI